MHTGPPSSAAGTTVRLILYQFEKTWQTNFGHWLSFWDPNKTILVDTAQNAAEVTTLPEKDPEIRILIFAAKTEFSPQMQKLWLGCGIRYIFSAQQFMELFRPDVLEPVDQTKGGVLYLDDNEDRFRALGKVLAPFGYQLFNGPQKEGSKRITSWREIENISKYPHLKWGNRPLLLLNLDHPNLALQPFLNSLEHDHFLPMRGEKILFRPKLLPFKDFELGSMWGEIQAGIRRFSKVILSFPELLEGIFVINLQQAMGGLDESFSALAKRSLNSFQKGNFADHLTNPGAAAHWPKLTDLTETKFNRLSRWQNAYRKLEFLHVGLSWLWQPVPAGLKAPEPASGEEPKGNVETG